MPTSAGPWDSPAVVSARITPQAYGSGFEEAIPVFVTMLVMPFTWSITNGIGAGFVTYVAIKLLSGRAARVHWMLYVATAAFVVYFLLPVIERRLT